MLEIPLPSCPHFPFRWKRRNAKNMIFVHKITNMLSRSVEALSLDLVNDPDAKGIVTVFYSKSTRLRSSGSCLSYSGPLPHI